MTAPPSVWKPVQVDAHILQGEDDDANDDQQDAEVRHRGTTGRTSFLVSHVCSLPTQSIF